MVANWNSTAYYSVNDEVLYNGNEYRAIQDNRNKVPTDYPAIWTDLAIEIITGIQPISVDIPITLASGTNHVLSEGTFGKVKTIINNNENVYSIPTLGTSFLGFDIAGSVLSLARVGNLLYIGGSFQTASTQLIPTNLSIVSFAILNITTGQISRPTTAVWIPASLPTINAILPMDNGLIYICGVFTTLYGVSCSNICVYNPLLQTFTALGTGLASTGMVMERVSSTSFLVGGAFSTAGGVTVNKIALFNITTTTFTALGSGLTGGTVCNSIVYDAVNTLTYAGGDFTSASSVAGTAMLSRWNGSVWASLTGTVLPLVGTGAVLDMTLYNDVLYVIGSFLNRGSTVVYNIADFVGGFMEIASPGTVPSITNTYEGNLVAGGNPYKVRVINNKLFIMGTFLQTQVLTPNIERAVMGIVYSDTIIQGTKLKPLGNGAGSIRAYADGEVLGTFFTGTGTGSYEANLSLDTMLCKIDISNVLTVTGTFLNVGREYTTAQFTSKGTAIELTSIGTQWFVNGNTPTLPSAIADAVTDVQSVSSVRFF